MAVVVSVALGLVVVEQVPVPRHAVGGGVPPDDLVAEQLPPVGVEPPLVGREEHVVPLRRPVDVVVVDHQVLPEDLPVPAHHERRHAGQPFRDVGPAHEHALLDRAHVNVAAEIGHVGGVVPAVLDRPSLVEPLRLPARADDGGGQRHVQRMVREVHQGAARLHPLFVADVDTDLRPGVRNLHVPLPVDRRDRRSLQHDLRLCATGQPGSAAVPPCAGGTGTLT